jgi:hypothetical protein
VHAPRYASIRRVKSRNTNNSNSMEVFLIDKHYTAILCKINCQTCYENRNQLLENGEAPLFPVRKRWGCVGHGASPVKSKEHGRAEFPWKWRSRKIPGNIARDPSGCVTCERKRLPGTSLPGCWCKNHGPPYAHAGSGMDIRGGLAGVRDVLRR